MSKIYVILLIIYTCLQQVRLETSDNTNTQIVNNNISLSNVITKVNKINQEKKPVPVELLSKVPINSSPSVNNISNNHINNVVVPVINSTEPSSLQKKPPTTGIGIEQMQQANISLTADTFIRGFYVFMGFGIIVLVYMGIKTIRVNQPPTPDTTVRKYGIKAKRGDLEMLPLPLAEDEDDDTLFDVGNHVRTGN
ncbi:uncharacterized protein LOC123301615 [Chrysoperla carnea]|uniref:uncharacterized protein LOC123301615 n=1 Tax=Chrysoperla carnea TaxID=189513 RepID=UPI001D065ADF|nr:uncharacterized protein LOC123301615 [Chrysoperla carnea]